MTSSPTESARVAVCLKGLFKINLFFFSFFFTRWVFYTSVEREELF